jgi:hypothetical protein
MTKMIYETMFDKLVKIGLITASGNLTFTGHTKIENKPYMDLSVDRLCNTEQKTIIISIAHNFVQNGDLMCDPDMEIEINPEYKTVEALTYQLSSMGIYQQVYSEPGKVYPKIKKDLNGFLNQWLSNLINQGFRVKSNIIEVD